VGTCSVSTTVTIENGVIENVQVINGCDGNLKGIMSLLKGMKPEDAIARMEGITCGRKPTSCPDQIAQCIKEALAAG
ncbi:MAG: TIGR03905 family TSCPD domain-containing protein, partial [Oscillospiraceae bacterium]|nr:TIGR03905 family TSCPD domain-containing protein [Oscillospiraceae bacterium]